MSKLSMSISGLPYGRVSFPLNSLCIHRSRPDILSADMDYVINSNGRIEGYGENPPENVAGVSTFGWTLTDKLQMHRIIPDCSILSSLPRTVIIVHDYDVCLRDSSDPEKQLNIPHFSICSIADDTYTPDRWQSIIDGSEEDSCQWLPGDTGDDCEIGVLDDGCNENEIQYFKSANFAVRALFLICRMIFPNLWTHDKLIVNGLLSEISRRRPTTLHDFLHVLNIQFLRTVLTILRRQTFQGGTASNYCGIVISEIEEFLSPSN